MFQEQTRTLMKSLQEPFKFLVYTQVFSSRTSHIKNTGQINHFHSTQHHEFSLVVKRSSSLYSIQIKKEKFWI